MDQAALRAAQNCGLPCGGWCPPGRICESGIIPARFPLRETPRERSPEAPDIPRSQRTKWNVCDSDATLILSPADELKGDPGTAWVARYAERYRRPLLVCDPGDAGAVPELERWLREINPQTLNVAGPSERAVYGIGRQTYSLLMRVFAALAQKPSHT